MRDVPIQLLKAAERSSLEQAPGCSACGFGEELGIKEPSGRVACLRCPTQRRSIIKSVLVA